MLYDCPQCGEKSLVRNYKLYTRHQIHTIYHFENCRGIECGFVNGWPEEVSVTLMELLKEYEKD